MFDVAVFLLSAGQQSDNPLLLLGQYSDDELEDDSAKKLDNAATENSSPGNKDEVINGFDYHAAVLLRKTTLAFFPCALYFLCTL